MTAKASPRSGGNLRIGISGWRYAPWRGEFFPEGLAQKHELEYASRKVNSIEINGSFYSLQRPESYRLWYDSTPDDFVFSVKAPRFITHIKRLAEVETPVANFLASGVLLLKEKLGPILWQLPPSLRYDRDKLEAFLKLLPHDTSKAAATAHEHDDKVSGRSWLKTDKKRPFRHTLEVRNRSFENEEFIALLRKYRVALVVADTAGKWPDMEDVTSDFLYLRLHGAEELYASGYTEEALKDWAKKIDAWSKGREPSHAKLVAAKSREDPKTRDVFIYFDNDIKVRAPFDAMALAKRLKVPWEPPMEDFLKPRKSKQT